MRSLPRHLLVHSDGRRLLEYGELRGSLEEEGPGAAGDGAEIQVVLYADRHDASFGELSPIFAVTQPEAAMLS